MPPTLSLPDRWWTAALLLVGAGAALAQGGPPPARVLLGEVRREPVEQWREVTGSLRAANRATVAAEAEGRVVELPVREGQVVAEGDLLARVDDTLAKLAVDSARAALAARRAAVRDAEAVLEKARRDLPRARRLFEESTAISEQVLDDAVTTVARAEAGLARVQAEVTDAEAALARARERLADTLTRAPFAGAVVKRHAERGEWLSGGDPVAELVSADELEAWLDVPERYLGRLRALEGRVQLRLPALGRVVEAPLTAIVPDADELARTLTVRVALDDATGLTAGMSVVGLVPTGVRDESLTVPQDAVLRDDAGEYVYVDGGGRAAVVRVETLFSVADRLVVRSTGLQPGARVVVEGHQRMFPGQPLEPVGGPGGS